ncbi:hypothetical protein F5Y05DRAFT_388335 [Hypoxylon sp. FL0543]|nr:hypothetical protein F5Y05DRAFT_388335 [Hypoxylon sp. FL0543]
MCVTSSVHCPKCGVFNETAITVCNTVLTHLDTAASSKKNFAAGEPVMYYCKDFVWPPVRPVPVVEQLCDDCMLGHDAEDHIQTWSVPSREVITINDDGTTHTSIQRPRPGPSIEVTTINDDGEMEKSVRRPQSYDHWPARLSEAAHRELTLRIPCCLICTEPRFFINKDPGPGKEGDAKYGIEGIQLQMNSLLWKWVCAIRNKHPITLRLVTGFHMKPCRRCIDGETIVRAMVLDYIEKCDKKEAWSLWNWLSLRAIPEHNFWENELPMCESNVDPPEQKHFHGVMTASWSARTGTAFSNAALSVDGDVDPHCFPFLQHKVPFTSLSQWNELVGGWTPWKPVPSIKEPFEPVDFSEYKIEYEIPDSVKKRQAEEEQQSQQPQQPQTKLVKKRKAEEEMAAAEHANKRIQFSKTGTMYEFEIPSDPSSDDPNPEDDAAPGNNAARREGETHRREGEIQKGQGGKPGTSQARPFGGSNSEYGERRVNRMVCCS